KQRFMSSVLIAIAVPCAAMSAMVFIVLGPLGFGYVLLVFASLAVIYVLVALLLNRFIKGTDYQLIIEIPPYRIPRIRPLAKKIGWRITCFLKDAVPYMMLGVTLAILAYNTGVMDAIGGITAPVVSGLLGLPEDAVIALLLGLLRKDVAVGVLLPMELSAAQLVVSMVVLGTMFPCIAVFVMLLKEFGLKGLAKAMGLMVVVSITAGTIMRLIMIGI
ncbi:MAG: nucleoside recognition domain-containing protein, partial [Candidatus Thermoplasmatota archaeon]|nr:nucleoside recognition domain-containing protein [Candidatus Thermoplasmatota archaeon]